MIRFFTYSQFHAKNPPVGSTQIRVDNLLKYWPEAGLYKVGEKPDVLILQKVYVLSNYKFIQNFPGIKILDICDPDWKDSPEIYIKETLDAVDAVVTSSQALADYLQTMTDTRCLEIKDRFDIETLLPPKKHFGQAKTVTYFGYAHNAETIRFAVPSLETRGLKLLIVANEDPVAWRWATKPEKFKTGAYEFVKHLGNNADLYKLLHKADMTLFPPGTRPFDKFKSENKSVLAELLGLPVIRNSEELDKMIEGPNRQKYIDKVYNKLKSDYDVRLSVREYKGLINEIEAHRR